jgi:hypothetical protein
MPNADQLAEAKKLRQKISFALSTGARTTPELATVLYPKADHSNTDPDYGRLSRILAKMKDEGAIKKDGLRGPWQLKAKPHVADLPDAAPQKRTYTKRNGTGATNGASGHSELRSYLVREIRSKLDELEALG